jgi:hypothetical protein
MRGILRAFWNFFAIRCGRVLLVPVTLAGFLTGLEPASASAATCVSWSGTPAASPGTPDTALLATAVLSPCDAWAVGWQSIGGVHQTLIEHWDGASWTAMSSPSPGTSDNALNGVHATSPANAWAVGTYTDSGVDRGLILHWDGHAWTEVTSPNPGSITSLTAIDAISASDAWAVGDYAIVAAGRTRRAVAGGSRTLVLHWTGGTWKQVASPTPAGGGALNGVTATSAGNAWAVGNTVSSGGDQTLILHWNGTAWKRQPSPDPGGGNGNVLTAADAISASNAWAVGAFDNTSSVTQNLVLHWNGAKWAQVTAPDVGGAHNFNGLLGVAATSASDARAVGGYTTPGGLNTLVLRWNGTNWAQVPSTTPPSSTAGVAEAELLGVAAGSASDFWAVGYFETTSPDFATLALHCC